MLGAIIGDIVGSCYEFNSIKTTEFELFQPNSRYTDDSVMTKAVAEWQRSRLVAAGWNNLKGAGDNK